MTNWKENGYKDYFKGRDWVHQLGFYAPDWKAFALAHHERFGSGPFFYTTNRFGKFIYRGQEIPDPPEFHACYGAWGSHSIEFLQQEPSTTPSFFTEINDMGKTAGFNHIHMFVEDLEEAFEACQALDIPVVVQGYADLKTALEKAEATGVDPETVKAQASKMSFMVVDMRRDCGCFVQLINHKAKFLHDHIVKAAQGWDGETDLLRPLGGN